MNATKCSYQPGQRSRYSDLLRVGLFGNRMPVAARFSAPVQTGCGAHILLYIGYRVSFPGVKRLGRDVNHPTPSSAEVKERKKEQSCTCTPPLGLHGLFQGELLNVTSRAEAVETLKKKPIAFTEPATAACPKSKQSSPQLTHFAGIISKYYNSSTFRPLSWLLPPGFHTNHYAAFCEITDVTSSCV